MIVSKFTREAVARLRASGRDDAKAYRVQIHARPIFERAAQDDGGVPVLVIASGLGSSGYYTPEFVRSTVDFFPGLDAFYDHPSRFEEADLPERRVRDKAGFFGFATLGKFTDPQNPQLGSRDAAFATFYPRVGDSEVASLLATTFEKARRYPNAAPFRGLSINGVGVGSPGQSPDDGRPVELMEAMTQLFSCDLVTAAGRLGRPIMPGTGARESGEFRPIYLRGEPAPRSEAMTHEALAGGLFTPVFLR